MISRREKFSYGLGDVAVNGINTIVSSYLLYYYTDIAMMKLGFASGILSSIRIIEGLFCLVAGILVDRNRSRYGHARPIVLVTALPCCAFLFCLFTLNSQSGMLTAGLTVLGYSICFGVLSTAYSTMMTCITSDNDQRIAINRIKSICSSGGAYAVTSLFLVVVALGEKIGFSHNYLFAIVVYSIIYMALILNCFLSTRERVGINSQKLSLKKAVLLNIGNTHMKKLWLFVFLMMSTNGMQMMSALYYAEQYLQKRSMGPVLLSVSTLLSVPVSMIIPKVTRKIGKKKMIIRGNILMILGFAALNLSGRNIWMALFSEVLVSIGLGFSTGIIFVMISDVVDDAEKKTGIRTQGMITSSVVVFMKLGAASASILSGWFMKLGGYAPGTAMKESAVTAIRLNYSVIPAILIAMALLTILKFKLYEEQVKQA